jgi:ferredoxin-thioredoxin reductase catalytic subunit
VKGSVFSPDVQVLDSTLQKMAKKTAEYGAKKATKKLEKKAKKEIEKAGKDLLNNLLKK